MNALKLVEMKKDDVFTDSMILAEGTGNQHISIARLIKKHRARLEKLGALEFMDLKSINPQGGRPTKVYLLNEPQATLLITFLDNSEVVADFKTELVRQFYDMRKFILERQTQAWSDTRRQGKLARKEETDMIQKLIAYAKEQGSTHADMLYVVYTRLANKICGIENKRDNLNGMQLATLLQAENIIQICIRLGMDAGKNYKEIYQDCKKRLEMFKNIAYIGQDSMEALQTAI